MSLRKIARNPSDYFNISVHTMQRSMTGKASRSLSFQNTSIPTFVWNVLDRDTRFLLASKVSEGRDTSGAVKVLQEAIKNVNGQLPQEVLMDKSKAYRQEMKWAFEDTGAKVDHIADCGIRKGQHHSYNRIERMNGTPRERVKVTRGWKTLKFQLPRVKESHIISSRCTWH